MVKNLTEGKPLNLLFFFALPMVAGNLFQQLYNMVDTAVVGKFVGEDAVAAVGSSFPIVFLSVAVASGLSMGCNVVVSQLFGARRIHEMKTTISTAIISLSVLGLIIMALGTVFAGPLLQLLGTDPDTVHRDLEWEAEKQQLRRCIGGLNPRERKIICLRFGLEGGEEMTQKQVADEIGISQSYISRLEKRIMKKLKTAMEQ